jgi:hypothetical protein
MASTSPWIPAMGGISPIHDPIFESPLLLSNASDVEDLAREKGAQQHKIGLWGGTTAQNREAIVEISNANRSGQHDHDMQTIRASCFCWSRCCRDMSRVAAVD